MKNILNIFMASAAVALAFVSCQKPEENVTEKTGIKFFTEAPIETKTVFGDLSAGKFPTLWTSTNSIVISQNKATAVEATVTPSADQKTAEFTPKSSIKDDETGDYTFYALSPKDAQVSGINSTYNSWNLEIPANQTPLDGSVDETAQILYATSACGSTFPTSVSLAFSHVTAYGQFSLANLTLDPGETINTITMTASENWAGRWYYYVEDNPSDPVWEGGMLAPSKATKTITLSTNKTSDIWFACAPVDLGGKTIDVTVATTLGTYSKTITIPAGKKFEAGKVAKFGINMAGVPRVSPVVYTLVTDVTDLTVGSEFIIASPELSVAAGKLDGAKYMAAQSVTISANTIADPNSAVEVFTIANGNVGGTYGFTCKSESDKFLKWDTGSSLATEASVSNSSSWAIGISGGTTTIRSIGDPTRYLLSNTSSGNRISTYVPGSNYKNVAIFKKAGTGSGSIAAKTPVSITATGYTTSYVKGASYSFDGTVTLTYSDLSTKELSASEYTVDDSDVNMSTPDTYTVTITYNADPSIKTTYDFDVESGSALTVWDDDFKNYTDGSLSSISGSKAGFTGDYSGINTVYAMSSGAIRVGKASGAGSITTPVLSKITNSSANLTITFKAAGWNGKTAKITITANNKGTVTEGQTTIASEGTMKGTTPSMTGTVYTFHVTGADDTTTLTFDTTCSIGIDDLKIVQTN